jgi:two-component system, response regulator YesN
MYRVVLIDDEKHITDTLSHFFPWQEYGFEVCNTFNFAAHALDFVSKNSVDLVLTDIRMPGMDGIALASELKRRNVPVAVMVLSGYADFEYARSALRSGIRDYFLKPVSYQSLSLALIKLKEELDKKYHTGGTQEDIDPGYYHKIVETVTTYVKQNYAKASLDEAATTVTLSPNYLSKVFKEETGKNFSEYLLEVKLENARKLLSDPNLKIYEIADAVGYDNPKNFTRAFKRYFGKSPWDFRKDGNEK